MNRSSYYQVVVKDGERVDSNLRAIAPSVRHSCGHRHRTQDTAERCHAKLMNWSADGRNCSATWYNAVIVQLDGDGEYVREAGWCLDCGAQVPDHEGAVLCAACNDKVIAQLEADRQAIIDQFNV